jgi:hypothetical protein
MEALLHRPDPQLTDAEIWHTAWLMTAFFGGAAEARRAALNHARLVAGNARGEEAWQRIAGALQEITAGRRKPILH